MRCYRICDARYRALDGEGARRYGGRWNRHGRAVIYSSSSRALAVLELLAQVERADLVRSLLLLTVEMPDDVAIEELLVRSKVEGRRSNSESRRSKVEGRILPRGWDSYPAPAACQKLGDDWLERAESLVLAVPSAIVPEERNYLINPAHPGFAGVREVGAREFRFDKRLS